MIKQHFLKKLNDVVAVRQTKQSPPALTGGCLVVVL
jgi:hypothetical protein